MLRSIFFILARVSQALRLGSHTRDSPSQPHLIVTFTISLSAAPIALLLLSLSSLSLSLSFFFGGLGFHVCTKKQREEREARGGKRSKERWEVFSSFPFSFFSPWISMAVACMGIVRRKMYECRFLYGVGLVTPHRHFFFGWGGTSMANSCEALRELSLGSNNQWGPCFSRVLLWEYPLEVCRFFFGSRLSSSPIRISSFFSFFLLAL